MLNDYLMDIVKQLRVKYPNEIIEINHVEKIIKVIDGELNVLETLTFD